MRGDAAASAGARVPRHTEGVRMATQPFSRGRVGAVLVCVTLSAGCATLHHSSRAEKQQPDSVSVGYGKQARKNVTGAVSSVNTESQRDNSAMQLEQLIQGRVSGVEIIRLDGARISLRIRGATSVNASTEPLYVIDGMKVHAESFTDAMAGINPGDVASIEVLKDAGATAIYGSEGANGVVIVTTRRGH